MSSLKICLSLDGLQADHVQHIQNAAPTATIVLTDRESAADSLTDADISFGWFGLDTLKEAARLRWIHLPSAGADRFASAPWVKERGIVVTNSSGVFGVPISEHVLALMLSLSRELHTFMRAQVRSEWHKDHPLDELYEKTAGILGMGDIGTEVARRAKAFGMRVVAMRRRPTAKPSFVDELYGPDQTDRVIREADFLIICLPGTDHTQGLLSRERIAMMKKGSFVVNIGRGSIVDEPALIEALQSQHLAGAGLDVFATEPLPAKSPLWQMENVIVTPHTSGHHRRHAERSTAIFCRNLRRFLQNEPLENVVDLEMGY